MNSVSKEERVQLALSVFKNGQYKTKKAASLAFDVPETTLQRRLQGTTSRMQTTSNCPKLSNTEESTLLAWILDMDTLSAKYLPNVPILLALVDLFIHSFYLPSRS